MLASLASPVAGAFLALAGVAYALAGVGTQALQQRALGRRLALEKTTEGSERQIWRGLAIAAAALAPIVVFALVFPEGGYEPFAPSVFWPGVAGVALIALLPLDEDRSRETLAFGEHPRFDQRGRHAFAAELPVSTMPFGHAPRGCSHGGHGCMCWRWSARSRCTPRWGATRRASASCSPRRWWRARCGSATAWALLALAPVLLYWQLETPINDVSRTGGGPIGERLLLRAPAG